MAGASLHLKEDSFQASTTHTHLFTPITFNRYGGQRIDLDPRYNSSCPSVKSRYPLMSAQCVGRNIADNLDFGALTFLYDGLFPNVSSSNHNILGAMFPTTARRLGEGLVVGRERIITKVSGTAVYRAGEWDFTVAGSRWQNRNPLRKPLAGDAAAGGGVPGRRNASHSGVEPPMVAIVRTFELGLLVANRTVRLPGGPGGGIAVRVANRDQIVIVALN